jgi:hypothetical protein
MCRLFLYMGRTSEGAEMNVILICPECNRMRLYGYDEWVKSCLPLAKAHQRIRCENERCWNKPVLLWHKDVKE